MKYYILIFLCLFFSSCYSPNSNKDLEYSGEIIYKSRGEHYIPQFLVKNANGKTVLIDVSNYILADTEITLFNYAHIGDSIWKKRGEYSIKVYSVSDSIMQQFEFWYKREWYYDGHE